MIDFHRLYKDYQKGVNGHLATNVLNAGCLLHWVMLLNPGDILEIGAGSGKTSCLIKRLIPKARVVAADVDPEICKDIIEFSKRASVDIEVECCDTLALPYKDSEFDICFSIGLLEHFKKELMVKAICEQLRVAKVVMLDVPLIHWFFLPRAVDAELKWTKVQWLQALGRYSSILDFTLFGPPTEEIEMLIILSNQVSLTLDLGMGLPILMGGQAET